MDKKKYFVKIVASVTKTEDGYRGIIAPQIIEVTQDENFDNLDFFHKHVASIIDIVTFYMEDLEKDFAFIIDDEGLLVEGNPILRIVYHDEENTYQQTLAGNILVGKNKRDESGWGIDTVGMSEEEVENFLSNTYFSVIGIVK